MQFRPRSTVQLTNAEYEEIRELYSLLEADERVKGVYDNLAEV